MSIAEQLSDEIGRWSEFMGAQAASNVYYALRDNCPEVTGALKDSITQPEQVAPAPAVSFRIAATAPQAEWTELGTDPHEIMPRQPGGVLVFEVNGQTVFTRHVNHPGNAPRPWFHPTCEFEWPQQLRDVADSIPLSAVG